MNKGKLLTTCSSKKRFKTTNLACDARGLPCNNKLTYPAADCFCAGLCLFVVVRTPDLTSNDIHSRQGVTPAHSRVAYHANSVIFSFPSPEGPIHSEQHRSIREIVCQLPIKTSCTPHALPPSVTTCSRKL